MLRYNKGFQNLVKSSPYFEEMGVDVKTVKKIGKGKRADVFSCNQGILRVSGNPAEYFQQLYFSSLDVPVPAVNSVDLIMKDGDLYFCTVRDDITNGVDDQDSYKIMMEAIAKLDMFRKRSSNMTFDEVFGRDDFTSLLTYQWELQSVKRWPKLEEAISTLRTFVESHIFRDVVSAISRFGSVTGLSYNDISADNIVWDGRAIIRDPYGFYDGEIFDRVMHQLEIFLRHKVKDGNISSFHRDVPGFTELWNDITAKVLSSAPSVAPHPVLRP